MATGAAGSYDTKHSQAREDNNREAPRGSRKKTCHALQRTDPDLSWQHKPNQKATHAVWPSCRDNCAPHSLGGEHSEGKSSGKCTWPLPTSPGQPHAAQRFLRAKELEVSKVKGQISSARGCCPFQLPAVPVDQIRLQHVLAAADKAVAHP